MYPARSKSHQSPNEKFTGNAQVEKFPTWMAVVALALIDESGRVLLAQRLAGKRHGGAWEFPGGKVEGAETPRAALAREISEELALTLDPATLQPALLAEEAGTPPIVMFLYTARSWIGNPQGLDGQNWGWFSPAEASALELAPMDRDLLSRLFTADCLSKHLPS